MEPEGFHDLVRRAQSGDRKAMDQVLEALRPQMEQMARPFADPSRPAQSTSDLLQESCLRAWQNLGSFEGGQNDDDTFAMFRAWIGQIVRRQGMNSRRDEKRQKRSPPQKILPLSPTGEVGSSASGDRVDALAPGPTPSANVRADETAQQVRAALAGLSDKTGAAILTMRFFDRMTIVQIAERLGIGRDQVRERYRVAMRQLEGVLDGLL